MKPTDSKNKPNNRKKTDTRNKTEVWQNADAPVLATPELPELPVVSRLRRVVDMSSMQPARSKKTEKPKKPVKKGYEGAKKVAVDAENERHSSKYGHEGAPKNVKSRRHRYEKTGQMDEPAQTMEHLEDVKPEMQVLAMTGVPESEPSAEFSGSPSVKSGEDVIHKSVRVDEAYPQADQVRGNKRFKKAKSAPKKRHVRTPRASELSVIEDNVAEAPVVSETFYAESAPVETATEDAICPELLIEPPVRKVRMAKSIKPKLHIADKHTHRKEHALKAPRLISRQHGHHADAHREECAGIVDTILASLMLKSWRARQWVMNISGLYPDMGASLQRCMPMVQARFVNNVCIDGGRLEATVGEQVASVGLRQFTPGQWRAVVNGLSERAIFTTSLLNGELPEGILEVFKQASLSLFPTKLKEFEISCDCESEQMPCKHVCALLLSFAQAIEEDPFHILVLRGMSRDSLLAYLRDARSDQVVDEKTRHRINYELPAQSVDFESFCTPKGNFEDLKFHVAYESNTLIRRLGDPSVWHGPMSFAAAVMPMIELASREAENLALGEQYVIPLNPDERVVQPVAAVSRAPKSCGRVPKFKMPDLSFVLTALSPEILETVPEDPVATAEDIIRWLKTRGASDIRTLARRTRLHKPTIEAFLNAFCDAGLTTREGEEEKLRFMAIF